MLCVNCNKFSAKDLALFIESMEQIIRAERLKTQRKNTIRAKYLADTLRYLSQQYPTSCSSTLSSTERPEEESLVEYFEEKQFVGISLQNHQSSFATDCDDCNIKYGLPFEHNSSTKMEKCDYSNLDLKSNKFDDQYEGTKKNTKSKSKFSLLNFIRKNLRKLFGSKTNTCLKSNSWTRLTIV